MQEINCILCGKHNEEVAIEENDYLGRRCGDCQLIYISPRPTIDETLDMYGHGEAHTGSNSYISIEGRLHAQHNFGVLSSYLNSGKLLEVGAGTGAFISEAQKHGFEAYAIELNPKEAKFIRDAHSLPCEEEPLSDDTFGGQLFDVIYHCNVTSHFYDPVDEFRKMHDRLLPGGLMVFETGNIGDIDSSQLKYFRHFHYPDHLFFFGENSTRQLLEKTGFEVVEIHSYSIIPFLTVAKVAMLAREKIRRLRGGREKTGTPESTEKTSDQPVSGISAKKLILLAWGYLLYFCRFGLGSLFPPRAGKPQSLLVVARRI